MEAKMPTSVRLEPEIERRIEALSAKTGRTKAFYLREMILRSLEDVEDYYLADAAMERLRKGEERTYTSAEVRKELGLDD
jgi:RHH-type rel operon transcriptional repressor/antitoxin RelB